MQVRFSVHCCNSMTDFHPSTTEHYNGDIFGSRQEDASGFEPWNHGSVSTINSDCGFRPDD